MQLTFSIRDYETKKIFKCLERKAVGIHYIGDRGCVNKQTEFTTVLLRNFLTKSRINIF